MLVVDCSLKELESESSPLQVPQSGMSMGEVVTLNVGGRLFTTTRTTLTSEPDSVLGRTFDLMILQKLK